MFGVRSTSASSTRHSDDLLVVQRAWIALQQVKAAPECCVVAAEQLRLAERLLRDAQTAVDRNDPLDTVLYLSRLAERHAQDGAALILRCRSERQNIAGWSQGTSAPGDEAALAIG